MRYSRYALVWALVLCAGAAWAVETALVFDGDKPHVELPGEPNFDFTTAMTVEAWVRFDKHPTLPQKWEVIVSKGESAWELTRFSNLNRVSFRTHNGLELHDLQSPVDLDPETWYHVAGTFDAASKTKALYINGELVVKTIYAGPIQTNDFKCLIGENEDKPNRAFDGHMDTVRIWSVARTAEQIKASVQREIYGNEPGIVAVYRFNDLPADSTTVLDSSKNTLSGTTKFTGATPNRVPGVAMGAPVIQDRVIELNGTDEYVRLRHEDQFDFTNEMSVEAWVYMSGGAGNRTIVSKGTGWILRLTGGGNAQFTGAVGTVTSATPLSTNTWTHVAATWNGSALVIYINGSADGDTTGLAGNLTANSNDVFIGAAAGPADFFRGSLDQVRIWANSRSPKQISDNYQRTLNGNEPRLQGGYEFDLKNGNVAVDIRKVLRSNSTVIIDFENLQENDNQVHDETQTVTEDGFQVQVVSGSQSLFSLGQQHGRWPNSAALYAGDFNHTVRLTRTAGGTFRMLSVDLSDLVAGQPAIDVTFIGTLSGGGTVRQTFTTDGDGQNQQRFFFSGFQDLTQVEWLRTSQPANTSYNYLFDNIMIQTADFTPDKTPSDGTLINMTNINRPLSPLTMSEASEQQYALQFNGTDEWVEILHDPRLNLDTFTVELWVNAADTAGVQTLFRKGETGYGLALDASEHLLFYYLDQNGTQQTLRSERGIATGAWQHVAIVVDQLTNSTIFYVNGQPAGEHDISNVETNDGSLILGRAGPLTSAAYYRGQMDEFRIWSHMRTEAEIEYFASRQLVPNMLNLFGHWNLNDGAGLEAVDIVHGQTAYLRGSMDNSNWVYGPDKESADGFYALCFDGINDYVEVPYHNSLDNLTSLTIEVWVKTVDNYQIDNSGTAQNPDNYRTIVRYGDDGWGLALDAAGFLRYHNNDDKRLGLKSSFAVTKDRWQHVAVRIDGTTTPKTTTFFINGKQVGQSFQGPIPQPTGLPPLIIGRQGISSAGQDYYKGCLDQLRIWKDARTDEELDFYANRQLGGNTGDLVGFWKFDDGSGTAVADSAPGANLGGTLKNATDAAWGNGLNFLQAETGFWDVRKLDSNENFSRLAITKGLWVGNVSLNAVSQVGISKDRDGNEHTSSTVLPTQESADFRVILHVNTGGNVSLLKKVTAMQQKLEIAPDPRVVLLTDDRLIPYFAGLIERDGKKVGKRYTAVAYDFQGLHVDMLGGIGQALAATGRFVLPPTHPTNPFRHKFHPDHERGFEVAREVTIIWDGATPSSPPGYGLTNITGTYREIIRGLHRENISVQGRISMRRISTVEVLNE